ncbi:MAG: asparaginase [Anaerovibrio sp.]|uniref:asparaginase n=1 Tax=Anaerovibrio sp. TaxID=1872532 RepID=UPI0025D2151D|nr:asparaginase [Anaerovibrio sp.]MCR5176062.1 asparaginase [Anaerovibrio sp.]
MKNVLLIATGGTIASIQTEDGMMPGLDGNGLIQRVPALKDICNIDTLQLMQLDSTNIHPAHWVKIAHVINENYSKYDGFVISHGTDTMAYTSSALYYMLENLNKPVIITGSQLSLTEEGSDAPDNLITAFTAAANGPAGVYLAFYGRLIQGNAAKKMYTENFYAFHSINVPEAALLKNGKLSFNPDYTPYTSAQAHYNKPLTINDCLDTNVIILELSPGFRPEYIRAIVDSGCHGIILKTFGAGGIPGRESDLNLLPAIDYAIKKGIKIVAASQCIYDGIHMDRYEVGLTALKHGVESGEYLTTEAMLVKMMLELGKK